MRPFVGQWNQGQGHGAGMSRRCQAGQNTYALGCGSHAANGIEAPYLYAQLQRSAQALAFFLQTPRQRSLRRKPNVVVGQRIGEADLLTRGQGMMARHHKYQLVVAVGIGRQARTRRAVGKNAQIGLVADNVVDEAGAVFFLEADKSCWVVAHEEIGRASCRERGWEYVELS